MQHFDETVDEELLTHEAVEEFIDDCKIRNLSPTTVHWYRERLKKILVDAWDIPLKSINIKYMKSVIAKMLETRAATTVNGYQRTAKAFFYYCQDNNYKIGFSPRQLKKLKEPQRLPPCFTPEQVEKLLAQPDKTRFTGLRDFTMMCLMLDVGLRLSELTGIEMVDVTLPYFKVKGKGDKQRILAMSDTMVKTLRKYLRTRERVLKRNKRETDFLFFTRTGEQIPNRRIDFILKKYGDMAGITGVRISAHTFRYTYTSMALRNGMSLTSLQTCLGHTTLAMTRHYAVINDQDAFEESRAYSPLAQVTQGNNKRHR